MKILSNYGKQSKIQCDINLTQQSIQLLQAQKLSVEMHLIFLLKSKHRTNAKIFQRK